jgi:hypothetical protein
MLPRCGLPRRSWQLEHNQCHGPFNFSPAFFFPQHFCHSEPARSGGEEPAFRNGCPTLVASFATGWESQTLSPLNQEHGWHHIKNTAGTTSRTRLAPHQEHGWYHRGRAALQRRVEARRNHGLQPLLNLVPHSRPILAYCASRNPGRGRPGLHSSYTRTTRHVSGRTPRPPRGASAPRENPNTSWPAPPLSRGIF